MVEPGSGPLTAGNGDRASPQNQEMEENGSYEDEKPQLTSIPHFLNFDRSSQKNRSKTKDRTQLFEFFHSFRGVGVGLLMTKSGQNTRVPSENYTHPLRAKALFPLPRGDSISLGNEHTRGGLRFGILIFSYKK
jgi:hypothetical protein